MKKVIVSSITFSAVSMQFPLVIACQADKSNLQERLMVMTGVKTLLGLLDENNLPKLQPFFDENYNLVTRNNGTVDFHETAFLNNAFLDEQNHAKDNFALQFLTNFLKLTPDKDDRFDLSNILLKVNSVSYYKIDTKILPNSDKKIIVFSNGVADFVFANKTSNAIIEKFNTPIKDAEIDIFNTMFNDKFENETVKHENYNDFLMLIETSLFLVLKLVKQLLMCKLHLHKVLS